MKKRNSNIFKILRNILFFILIVALAGGSIYYLEIWKQDINKIDVYVAKEMIKKGDLIKEKVELKTIRLDELTSSMLKKEDDIDMNIILTEIDKGEYLYKNNIVYDLDYIKDTEEVINLNKNIMVTYPKVAKHDKVNIYSTYDGKTTIFKNVLVSKVLNNSYQEVDYDNEELNDKTIASLEIKLKKDSVEVLKVLITKNSKFIVTKINDNNLEDEIEEIELIIDESTLNEENEQNINEGGIGDGEEEMLLDKHKQRY